ncbi:hypothetical protein [Actinoallomurus acanthiterrae]
MPRAIASIITNDIRSGEVFTGDDTDRNPGDGQTFIWVSFNPNFGRYLRLTVRRSPDPTVAHANLLVWRSNVASKRTVAESHVVEDGAAKTLAGVGDEAYTLSVKEWAAVHPDRDLSGRTYDIGGSYVCARFRNILVSIFFEGADYSSGVVKGNEVKGNDLGEAETRRYSMKLIRAIKERLY